MTLLDGREMTFDNIGEWPKALKLLVLVVCTLLSFILAYQWIVSPDIERLDQLRVAEEQLRHAARSAVCKVNIDSDGRLAMTAFVRKALMEDPGNFDPRKYHGPARDGLIGLMKHKNEAVLGSAGNG